MSAMDEEWFIINNLDELVNSSRALVFNNFGKEDNNPSDDILSFTIEKKDIKEINEVLSFEESKVIIQNLIKKQNHKLTKKIRYLLNDHIYLQIINQLNDRMISNILNSLVNRGLVETAYDENENDFVFWLKEDNNENKEKPKTD